MQGFVGHIIFVVFLAVICFCQNPVVNAKTLDHKKAALLGRTRRQAPPMPEPPQEFHQRARRQATPPPSFEASNLQHGRARRQAPPMPESPSYEASAKHLENERAKRQAPPMPEPPSFESFGDGMQHNRINSRLVRHQSAPPPHNFQNPEMRQMELTRAKRQMPAPPSPPEMPPMPM